MLQQLWYSAGMLDVNTISCATVVISDVVTYSVAILPLGNIVWCSCRTLSLSTAAFHCPTSRCAAVHSNIAFCSMCDKCSVWSVERSVTSAMCLTFSFAPGEFSLQRCKAQLHSLLCDSRDALAPAAPLLYPRRGRLATWLRAHSVLLEVRYVVEHPALGRRRRR